MGIIWGYIKVKDCNMESQPKIENDIKQYIDFQHRLFWDELRRRDAVSELTQYILKKNKSKNKSIEAATNLSITLIRKSLPVSFKYFAEIIKQSSEAELQEIIENVNLSPDVNLGEQLKIITAGYYGIKGRQASIDFFTWVDLFILDVQIYQFLTKLRQNPRPLKIDSLWQFVNLVYGLNIGPNLGCKLTDYDLYDLRLFPRLDFSYLEDYKFPEPFTFNLEMFIKAGGSHEWIINKMYNVLQGLTRKEYFEFWHSELKFVSFPRNYEYDIRRLLKKYLKNKIISN